VHWVETQDLSFKQYKFEHFIEVGPSPTPTGMATRTLKAKYKTKDDSTGHIHQISVLPRTRRRSIINLKMNWRQTLEPDAPADVANPSFTPVATAPLVVAASPPTTTASPAVSIEDVPIHTVGILAIIVSEAEEATQ